MIFGSCGPDEWNRSVNSTYPLLYRGVDFFQKSLSWLKILRLSYLHPLQFFGCFGFGLLVRRFLSGSAHPI